MSQTAGVKLTIQSRQQRTLQRLINSLETSVVKFYPVDNVSTFPDVTVEAGQGRHTGVKLIAVPPVGY